MNFGTLVIVDGKFYIELPIGELVLTDGYYVVKNQVVLTDLKHHIGKVVSILPVAA